MNNTKIHQQKSISMLNLKKNTQIKIQEDINRIKREYCGNVITREYNNDDYDTIDFITLTNTGYIDYTLNCYKSLKNIGLDNRLKSYCIGEGGFVTLQSNNHHCEFINDNCSENFQTIRSGNWSTITYYKFEIIHKHLLNNRYVCITDGDIVYENSKVFDYLLDNIKDNDLIIQSEGLHIPDLCSGFMFIQSNENTINLFNPENVKKYQNNIGWDDQVYVNSIRDKLKYKKLPLHLFPTGNYYYRFYNTIQPYLIHFNWIKGHEKKNRMKKHNKWFII
jgi:hypothetical protein